MTERRILVVDDDPPLLRTLHTVLSANGFDVAEVDNGYDALDRLGRDSFNLLILDLLLPDIGGVEVCAQLRTWSRLPVVVLSAIGEEAMKVDALHAGADDYVTKPFGVPELLARIESALRRESWGTEHPPLVSLAGGAVVIDLQGRSVTRGVSDVHLTPLEFDILSFLARNGGRVITHQRLLRSVMGAGYEDATGALRVHVLNLRRKLEDVPSRPRLLLTEPGVGYRLITD
jgi:two-component system KDP operon response regulator KdpE